MADARIPCPACRGLVHPISGRCKHCKADLHALRGARPSAAAQLPALGGSASAPLKVGKPVVAARPPPEVHAAEILPPRATNHRLPAAPARRGGLSPLVIAALVAAVGAIAVVVVVLVRQPSAAEPPEQPAAAPKSPGSPDAAPLAEAPGPAPGPADAAAAPAPVAQVRPPVDADLAEYTKDLPDGDKLVATIDTSLGKLRCELFDARAPKAVANFIGLATGKKPWTDPRTNSARTDTPFYDRLEFHRVIEEFMIQGGDPLGNGTGGPGYQFEDEIDPQLAMEPGTLAMANAGANTNGSQFFITETAPDWLNGKHTIFGKCGSRSVIRRIARVPTDGLNHPTTPVLIRSIKITRE